MNRSAERETASRFTRFVCPALRFIPHEPRKKDTHSLNIYNGIISPSLNHAKNFDSIPDEQSQKVVRGSWSNHLRSNLH